MISLWASLGEDDIAAYASGLVLPEYLAHLALAPFRFRDQAPSADGQEPLRLTYRGDGRLEEFLLHSKDHALGMVRSVCPGIRTSKIRLPRDDARWHWDTAEGEGESRLRIYFEPVTRLLYPASREPASPDAYVSVTRGHVFVGRAAVEAYLTAWLDGLGAEPGQTEFVFDTPSGGVQFATGAVAGQMFLADEAIAEELIRFAGVESALTHVSPWAELDLSRVPQEASSVREDGIYIQLARREV